MIPAIEVLLVSLVVPIVRDDVILATDYLFNFPFTASGDSSFCLTLPFLAGFYFANTVLSDLRGLFNLSSWIDAG